jgi:hypothetical protein
LSPGPSAVPLSAPEGWAVSGEWCACKGLNLPWKPDFGGAL